MDSVNLQTVAAVLAILLGIGGLAKYVFYLIGRHEKEVEQRIAQQDKKLEEHGTKLSIHSDRLQETREEMHRDFVHRDSLADALKEIRKVQGDTFERINSIDKALNQLVGAFRGKKADIDEQ